MPVTANRHQRRRSRRAVAAIEYGIIAAAIIVAIIDVLRVTGNHLEDVFKDIGNVISAQTGAGLFPISWKPAVSGAGHCAADRDAGIFDIDKMDRGFIRRIYGERSALQSD